jgi:hypothetical protein
LTNKANFLCQQTTWSSTKDNIKLVPYFMQQLSDVRICQLETEILKDAPLLSGKIFSYLDFYSNPEKGYSPAGS